MYPTRVAGRTPEVARAAGDDNQAERRAIEAVLDGDRAAFRVLLERHQRGVYTVMLRLIHDASEAEDLTQQAFLQAFDALGHFELGQKFSSWIYRIAINLAKDHLKSKRRGELAAGDALDGATAGLFAAALPSPEKAAVTDEEKRRLARALGQLSLSDRTVLVLKDIEELRYDEIKRILGSPVTALKIRVIRARQRLRKVLERG